MHLIRRASLCAAILLAFGVAASVPAWAAGASAAGIPRTASGKPDLQGIWQVRNRAAYGLEEHNASLGILPGKGVVDGGTIPYQPAALAKRNENFAQRAERDPFNQCFMPGVPRIMYLEHPFQIFQTDAHVAMTFEWSQVFRLIYTDDSPHVDNIEFWMGDSRGHWEGDTLVVEVTNYNDQTWLDAAGNFHSEQLKLTERYTLRDADTLDYEATFEDPQVFTRPWTIRMPFYRHRDMGRLLEYQCQAEKEEANGDFERDPRTWYPGPQSQGAP
ncbi:MAG: hypothetical protein LBE59_05075 [Nevskiaceae bacterium]|jgi:hypothetical protein|nr:hypothetical protein [Nevskiaceae bacterium]